MYFCFVLLTEKNERDVLKSFLSNHHKTLNKTIFSEYIKTIVIILLHYIFHIRFFQKKKKLILNIKNVTYTCMQEFIQHSLSNIKFYFTKRFVSFTLKKN